MSIISKLKRCLKKCCHILPDNLEIEIDSEYHEFKVKRNTYYYIIDKYYPYVAIYGIKGIDKHICTLLNVDELPPDHILYYEDAEKRLFKLYKDVNKEKVEVKLWDVTEVGEDYYNVEYDWPVPNPQFDIETLMHKVVSIFCRFVDIDENQAILFSLWVAHTFITDFIDTSPLLIIKCCDDNYDARLSILSLIMTLTKNPVRASAANPRLFLENYNFSDHTILFDDPSVIKNREMLNLIINARFRSDAIRYIKGKDKIASFKTFGAKVIMSNDDLPKSIVNNGMIINLGHSRICSRPDRITEADQDAFDEILDGFEYFAEFFGDKVSINYPELLDLTDIVNNYEKDNWLPLFKIAKLVGDDYFNNAVKACQSISSISTQYAVIRQQLLSDVYNIVNATASNNIGSESLRLQLCSLPGKPWSTYDRGDGITCVQVAELLGKFGIKSKNIRVTNSDQKDKVLKGYEKSRIVKAYIRYIELTSLSNAATSATT